MNYKWTRTLSPDIKVIDELSNKLGIDPTLCNLLAQRQIQNFTEAKDFFRPQLKNLHDPYLMKDMDKAVARIESAIDKKENILVYGDYDVDGTTAVSLLSSFLLRRYSNVDTYIPDRYNEGYGVSTQGIDYASDNDISLIIALDCGIKALEKVDYAKSLGIDFIICDHHRPGDNLPDAVAILDPKRSDCSYPYDELSGCGVGFKLSQALSIKWGLNEEECLQYLDLLAVSIGSDIVPITGENRILAFWGLERINTNPRPGFKLLIELAGKKNQELSIMDVVFLLGPRINAAGRISHGKLAVSLLSGHNVENLKEDAEKINKQNDERKVLDKNISAAAIELIRTNKEEEKCSTVVYDPTWHKGVIGIVASRLIENYYRPTVVFTKSKNVLAGSARSVKGFDVYNALDACSDILEQFGGHMYAAGMTLLEENYDAFKKKFEEVVAKSIKEEHKMPIIEINSIIQFDKINFKFYRILKQFGPFGPKNMAPIFRTDNLVNSGNSRPVGGDKTHLRLEVIDPETGIKFTGIGFGLANKLDVLNSGEPFSIAYHLDENNYRGNSTLQLRVLDIKATEDLK